MGIFNKIKNYLQKDYINNKNAVLRIQQLSIEEAKKEALERLGDATILTYNSENVVSKIENFLPSEIRDLFYTYQTIEAKETLDILGRQYLQYIDEKSLEYPEYFESLESLKDFKKIKIGCVDYLDIFCDLIGGHRVFCASYADAPDRYYIYESVYHFLLINMIELLDYNKQAQYNNIKISSLQVKPPTIYKKHEMNIIDKFFDKHLNFYSKANGNLLKIGTCSNGNGELFVNIHKDSIYANDLNDIF